MKKLIITLSILIALMTGCNTSDNKNNQVENNNTKKVETTANKETETTELEQNEETKDNKDSKEDDQTDDTDDESKEAEKEENIESLYEESDYVSILRKTQTGSNGYEISISEDLKGSLNSIVLPKIDNIESNKDYLVFMKDSPAGEIVPTSQNSFYEVSGKDDKNVETIREIIKSNIKTEPEETKSNK